MDALAEARGALLPAGIKHEPDDEAFSPPLHRPPPDTQPSSDGARLRPPSSSPASKQEVPVVSPAVKPDLSATESASGGEQPDAPPEEVSPQFPC